jgi:hypothetical protein
MYVAALIQKERAEDIEFLAIAGAIGTVGIWLVIGAICFAVARQSGDDGKPINEYAYGDPVIILVLTGCILFLTGFWGQLKNKALKRACDVELAKLDRVFGSGITCRGTYVVLLMIAVIMVYLIGYSYVVGSIHEVVNANPANPDPSVLRGIVIHYIVVAANAAAVSAILLVTIRYAEYIRLLAIAHVLCRDFEKLSVPAGDDKPALDLTDLGRIRDALAKRDTIFEPPGNMFVVIGITGTFLGLALGLTTLPLHEILQIGQDAKLTSAQAGEKALDLAMPFVRSMGLALGISTMGVIGSVAAQWLRGFSGPPVATERVLDAAGELLTHKGKRAPTIEQAVLCALHGAGIGNQGNDVKAA